MLLTDRKIVVVEDDRDQRYEVITQLAKNQLSPVAVEESGASAERLFELVRHQNPWVVICDQNLDRMTASSGAGVVALCTAEHIPALLYSQQKDHAAEIRHILNRIPRYINRDELFGVDFVEERAAIKREQSKVPEWRRPYRTVLEVEEVLSDGNIQLIVGGWEIGRTIEMDPKGLAKDVQDRLAAGLKFFAEVNISADSESNLFVVNSSLSRSLQR